MGQNTSVYQLRIDKQEKQEVFQIFDEMGIKPSQAIKLFLRKVKETRSMPFDISAPNREPNQQTADYLCLSDDKKEYQKLNKASDLLLDLDVDD